MAELWQQDGETQRLEKDGIRAWKLRPGHYVSLSLHLTLEPAKLSLVRVVALIDKITEWRGLPVGAERRLRQAGSNRCSAPLSQRASQKGGPFTTICTATLLRHFRAIRPVRTISASK
jgi:hypothetical protein